MLVQIFNNDSELVASIPVRRGALDNLVDLLDEGDYNPSVCTGHAVMQSLHDQASREIKDGLGWRQEGVRA